MKKVVSILLVVCIMLSIMPFALAAEPVHEHNHNSVDVNHPCCSNPSLVYEQVGVGTNIVIYIRCINCGARWQEGTR